MLNRETPTVSGDCSFSTQPCGYLACGPGEQYVKGQQVNYHSESKNQEHNSESEKKKGVSVNVKL